MTHEEIAVQFEHHHNEIESLKHRMKKCEEQTALLNRLVNSTDKLALNMEYMAKEQQKQGERLEKQGERLEKLEHEPAEDFKHYKRVVIGCIITGVLGALLGALLALVIQGV